MVAKFIQPQSSGLSGLGECYSLITNCNWSKKNSSQVYRCTFADLVCVVGESHWQRCERQPQLTSGMCVSQRWKFWRC